MRRGGLLKGILRVAGVAHPTTPGYPLRCTATSYAVVTAAASYHTWSPLPLAPARAAPPFQCGACGKSFRLLNALHHHILTKHAGEAKALRNVDGTLEEVSTATAPTAAGTADRSAAAVGQATPAAPIAPAAAAGFPGLFSSPIGGVPFGGAPSSPRPAAAATASEEPADATPSFTADASSPAADTVQEEDPDKRQYVCTICQKTFRLEAALQHHYQAKHNMDMPSGGDASSSTADAAASTSPTAAAEDATTSPLHAAAYIRQQEAALPQAPQYHVDVAPNAPEEGDVAAHWRCVNNCVLMGVVRDLQEGYVFEDHVLQFTVVTDFEGPSPGDPDKDFHTVRVYDEGYWRPLRDSLREGQHCLVSGRLRMVPQYDTAMKKYYHFPVMQVYPGTGNLLPV